VGVGRVRGGLTLSGTPKSPVGISLGGRIYCTIRHRLVRWSCSMVGKGAGEGVVRTYKSAGFAGGVG